MVNRMILFTSHKRQTPPNLSPGPNTLIGGNTTAGFYGETTADELISGDNLATALSFNEGTPQNSAGGWLKFSLDNKILYVAKKPFRVTLLWAPLSASKMVYGDRQVLIGGFMFKIRLITGYGVDPCPSSQTVITAPSATNVSEWNRLIYPVVNGTWASYTNADPIINNTAQTWCQETGTTAATHVLRGVSRYDDYCTRADTGGAAQRAWRPVLELVR